MQLSFMLLTFTLHRSWDDADMIRALGKEFSFFLYPTSSIPWRLFFFDFF